MTHNFKEKIVQQQVWQALAAHRVMTWRNNIGCARYGQQFVQYGLGGKGGSDLIGIMPLRVTSEMVGKTLGVFVAVETKRSKGGKVDPLQEHFIDLVRSRGGIAGVAASWEDAVALIQYSYSNLAGDPHAS